ncbi:unnamed protein product [Heligmosomoides polygyrus]|uniref:Transposase n=1 Tax=Heligmosomoides polygyrus TaxID=6339 RepID=A0A183F3Y2_HELPZ|nr:unnamed protein product [Heligmosomoides polygyrus]
MKQILSRTKLLKPLGLCMTVHVYPGDVRKLHAWMITFNITCAFQKYRHSGLQWKWTMFAVGVCFRLRWFLPNLSDASFPRPSLEKRWQRLLRVS